jgi:CheY-like chemotaxis protein
MPTEPIILLVEDDINDALLAKRALKQAGVTSRIAEISDGEEAITYLAGNTPFHDRTKYPLPSLILLDLKMPKLNGFEVLSWLQSRPELAKIPVVVLTGSMLPEDRNQARQLGAVGYEVKPVEFEQIVAIAQNLKLHFPDQSTAPRS